MIGAIRPATQPFLERVNRNSFPMAGIGTLGINPSNLQRGVALGIRVVDTAKAYKNEKIVGDLLRSVTNSDKVIVITKLFDENLNSIQALRAAIQDSTTEIGKIPEYFLIHGPYPTVQMKVLLQELESMKLEGLVKDWGVSNFDVKHLEVLAKWKLLPKLNQVECHPYFQRKELQALCEKFGVTFQAYRPLSKGDILNNSLITDIAKNHQTSAAKVVYAWMANKGIPMVTKVSSEEHQKEYATCDELELTVKDIESIDKLDKLNDFGRTCTKGGWFVPFSDEIVRNWEKEFLSFRTKVL